ncbi:MAG TPA: hypothetical protein ENK66_09500 [Arcobacter sp.]|nr:hypothetical protein [Arcobacter sp.]
MKFKRVELHAFRAYKDKKDGTFDFTLSGGKIANFISIYAPNGFGKTSFYDAVEWGMTNQISRFKNKDYSDLADEERKYINKENHHREKQFILRNKYVDDSVEGFVNIITNIREHKKMIPSITRAGGKDYFKNETVENKYFKNVILSQDGIDDFLKSDNPKARYDKFSSHFIDDDLVKYYDNIKILEKENNRNVEEIKKNITTINNFLMKPIDKNIFEFSNEKIEKLNKEGSDYSLIDDSFNETKKIEFESKLNQHKLKITKQIEYNNILKEKLPKWLEDSMKYFENKKAWGESQNKLTDYEELKKYNVNIKLLNKEQINKKDFKLKLDNLKKTYPSYITIKDEIKRNEDSLQEEQKKVIPLEVKKNKAIKAFENLEKEVITAEKKKTEVDTLILAIPQYYKDIKTFTILINEYQKTLAENSKIEETIDNLENDKSKYISIKEAIKNNIFLDISSDKQYENKVLDIEKLLQENEEYNTQLDIVKKDEEEYKRYDSQLNDLLSMGMNIIDKKSSNICPLCNTKQDSYDILKSKILDNPFLDKLGKELLEKKANILENIRINSKKIEDDKNLILSDYNKKIADIKSDIKKLQHKEKKIDTEKLEQYKRQREELLSKTENKSEEEFLSLKVQEQKDVKVQLDSLYENKKAKEAEKDTTITTLNTLKYTIENIEKNIAEFKSKEEYTSILDWASTLKNNDDLLVQLNNNIDDIDKLLDENRKKLIEFNKNKEQLENKLEILDIENLNGTIERLKNSILKLNTEITTFELLYKQYFSNEIEGQDTIQEDVDEKYLDLEDKIKSDNDIVIRIESLEKSTNDLLQFIENKHKKKELEDLENDLKVKDKVLKKLEDERKKVEKKIENDVKAFFQEDLINQIYEKIDPHPDYKKVKFECSFEKGVGKLNIFVNDKDNSKHISPSLYYSTAQLNVLSLSIFLAKALNVQDKNGNRVDCIFIDDPVQSMDNINILSTIDLLRSLVVNHNKQIILSTHDENFHRLLEKKIPTEYFDSKFIELETFGTVKNGNS